VGFGPLFLLGKKKRANWQLAKAIMESRSVAERVGKIAEQAAIDQGVELVHAEVAGPEGHPIVRVFIDKPGGVTHEDCSAVSNQLGTVLDVEDFIHSAYTLEVSSPGLERGLYKRADYERFAGSQAKIKARTPIKGQRNFRGRIIGVDDNKVILEDRTSGRMEIPVAEIAKANLEVDVENEFRLAREREELDKELIKKNAR
jgi:ribosome maturation factor RimP